MPKTTLKYNSKEEIPASLQPFATEDFRVEIWYGGDETVGKETNKAVADNMERLVGEKRTLQGQYDSLLSQSTETTRKLSEAQLALANGQKVSPEDIQFLNSIKPLGTVEEIKERVEKYPTLAGEIDKARKSQLHQSVFKALGYSNEKVFMDLMKDADKLSGVNEITIETVDGKQVPYVKIKDAAGVESKKAFTDYVKDNPEWQPYLPALTQQQGTPWIQQKSVGDTGDNQPSSLLGGIISGMSKVQQKQRDPLQPSTGQREVNQN